MRTSTRCSSHRLIESLLNAPCHGKNGAVFSRCSLSSLRLLIIPRVFSSLFSFRPGDAGYKPYVTAEPDIQSVTLEGSEDFLIIGCDGLWDTVGTEEAAFIVLQYLHYESKWPFLPLFSSCDAPGAPGRRIRGRWGAVGGSLMRAVHWLSGVNRPACSFARSRPPAIGDQPSDRALFVK